MRKPLDLFIQAPFAVNDTPPGPWSLKLAYGDQLPAPLVTFGNEVAEFVLLETTNTAAPVLAAATGYLSTRFAGDEIVEPGAALAPATTSAEPATLALFLNPRPFLDLYPGFTARASQLRSDFDAATMPSLLDQAFSPPGVVRSFYYLNLDTQMVKLALGPYLDRATLPPASTPGEREHRWRLFLQGDLAIPVDMSDLIGAAGEPLTGGASGIGQVGFGVLARGGTIDPAAFFDWLRTFVESEAMLDDFLGLVPKRWPLLGGGMTSAQAMQRISETVYPYEVLNRFVKDENLPAAQVRQIGDAQKALYRKRLLQRTGHAPAGDTSPPFEFNDFDAKNLYQLEAMVEYYANFTDPRATGAQPIGPTLDDGSVNPGYQVIDFLPRQGAGATVSGQSVTFDGSTDLTGIWPHKDVLYLAADTNPNRPSRTYRIESVDETTKQVTLDAAPNLGGAAASAWRLIQRPYVVVIDAFGPRMRGTSATVVTAGANARVALDAGTDLSRINKYGFDTIYFPADTAGNVRPRTYGIIRAHAASGGQPATLELDGSPSFAGGASAWHIPAGLGGRLPDAAYTLGISDARGWDHYDGVLFVVYNGEVTARFRWTSYTSHKADPGTAAGLEARSSIRGNAPYLVESIRSGKAFINFAFRVVGNDLVQRSGTGRSVTLDGVRENRRYFEQTVTDDSVTAPAMPAYPGGGKTVIRLHYGMPSSNSGTGSEGCVVSDAFFDFRAALIDIAQQEHAALHGAGQADADLARVRNASTLQQSQALYNAANQPAWDGKIVGTMWLIRPDERPIG